MSHSSSSVVKDADRFRNGGPEAIEKAEHVQALRLCGPKGLHDWGSMFSPQETDNQCTHTAQIVNFFNTEAINA